MDTEEQQNRFTLLSAPVEELILGEKNPNTLSKTRRDVYVVEQFLALKGETLKIEELPPAKLNDYLAEFVLVVKRQDGEDYEPSSIRGYVASVERYLRNKNYGKSVINDPSFKKTIDAMKARFKMLKREGKGEKPNASDVLTDNDVDVLYSKNILDASSATSLLNTVWLNNCLFFGMRGGLEHRNLQWRDVCLFRDSAGREFLKLIKERQTKTRQGNDPNNLSVKGRMYAVPGSDRCPVTMYKVYAKKREGMSCPAFYLSVNGKRKVNSSVPWFKDSPIGQNKLATIMKTMANEGGLDNPRLTNHSARKRMMQTLVDNDVAPTEIVQISGHKNLHSINNYSHLSEKRMLDISSIMSGDVGSSSKSCSSGSGVVDVGESSKRSSSKTCSDADVPPFLQNAIIHGGEFHFHFGSSSKDEQEHRTIKRRRVMIMSDDSSQEE